MSEEKTIPIQRRLTLGEELIHEGIKYVAGCTMADILHVAPGTLTFYAHAGMPHIMSDRFKQPLYPVDACIEWHKARGGRRGQQLIVDGELYYSIAKFSEVTGIPDSTLHVWVSRSGMPCEKFPSCRGLMLPFIRTLQWIDEHRKEMEMKAKQRNAKRAADISLYDKQCGATLCWDCKNARAGKCAWFTDYSEVDGWEAMKVPCMESWAYYVIKCPNFERDEPRKQMYY
jgi:hypothetical protein